MCGEVKTGVLPTPLPKLQNKCSIFRFVVFLWSTWQTHVRIKDSTEHQFGRTFVRSNTCSYKCSNRTGVPCSVLPRRTRAYGFFPWIHGPHTPIRKIPRILLKLAYDISVNFHLTEPHFCGIIKVMAFFWLALRKRKTRTPFGIRVSTLKSLYLSALLNESNLIRLTIDLEMELTLRVSYLRFTILVIRFVHRIDEKINDLTLSIIRLAGPCSRGLGLRGFLNLSLILVPLLSQIARNSDRIANLLSASLLKDVCRNNNSLRGSVLVGERILDVSRVHATLLHGTWGGPSPPPLGRRLAIYCGVWRAAALGDLEGSGVALLLTLVADNTLLLDEVTEGSAHLLSRAAKLRSHVLVGDGLGVVGESGVDVLTEVHDLLVHASLARTSSVLLDLLNLLLAEGNDLGVVSHVLSDAGVEVLLGGLGLGHGSSPFLPCGCPFGQPLWLTRLFEEVILC